MGNGFDSRGLRGRIKGSGSPHLTFLEDRSHASTSQKSG